MQADKSQASTYEPGTIDARQQLLGAAMASGSRSRMGGGQGRRKHSSRLRLDAVEHVALAARSKGPSSQTVDGFERRSLSWSHLPDGSLAFRAVLPPDMAANLIACLEHQESLEYTQESVAAVGESDETRKRSSTQRQADSLVSMGEASLEAAGDGVSTADRFQVVVHVDADPVENQAGACTDIEAGSEAGPSIVTSESSADLDESARIQPASQPVSQSESQSEPTTSLDGAASADTPRPQPIRAAIAGIGGISPSTARRLACDGSLVTVIMRNGEPLSIGR